MAISFQQVFGIHEQSMALRGQRAEVLANNIANADTPGYKARDLDFAELLTDASNRFEGVRRTQPGHIGQGGLSGDANLKYRTPLQPSIDGNTVEMQMEKAEYMKNALRFQASMTFLNGKVKGMMSALRGE